MGTVAGMLAEARKLLGTGRQPAGSNHNKVTKWYGFDGPWCDMSISYEAGHSDNLLAVFGKFAYTVFHAQAFQRNGRWHFGLGGARAGDVVFFDFSGTRIINNIDHVGLIEAVRSDGTIVTLEGNTSDAFHRRVRNSACVVGYGRPAYGDAAPLPDSDGILRVGSAGKAVKALQRKLNTVMNSGLVVNGSFGKPTKAALEKFQRKFGLTVDGEYGPHSAAMMKAALAGRRHLSSQRLEQRNPRRRQSTGKSVSACPPSCGARATALSSDVDGRNGHVYTSVGSSSGEAVS